MDTAFYKLSSSGVRLRQARAPRLAEPAAIYIGTMPGYGRFPEVELFNLLVPAGEHPVGSTVSRSTLEEHGLRVPCTVAHHRGDADMVNVACRRSLAEA